MSHKLLAVFFLCVSKGSALFDDNCVAPPLICPNKNITFWLYTRANQNNPHELKVLDTESIASAPWVRNSPIKVLIHGYTGHKDFSPNTEIRPAYMECCDYNIISVDYNKIALAPCYFQAARNTKLVGMCLAQLIDEMVQNHNFQLKQFHVIGFSLGGQTAGYLSNYLKSGKIDRISGLDPALPMFATSDKMNKLDSDDAHYVDVLHTNALVKGKLETSGHADFYSNGGVVQPGCKSTKNQTKGSALFDDNCVAPPLICPNKNITFWLYTRANQNNPHELKVLDTESIASAPWVRNSPIKVLIHGYTGHKDFSPNTEIRPAYMECCDYNIISVDYNKIALAPCYFQAARNTKLVGMCLAQLIDEMVQNHNFQLKQFHVIGFSLGGQTAGYLSNYLKSGKIDRISGLDPALPMFATSDKMNKLDSDDAHYVDVLHTNALVKGKLETSGHADFYSNGGVVQPGCKSTKNQTKSGCDHARAPIYYAESILTTTGFYATKCYSWLTYIIGFCNIFNSSEEVLYGEYVSRNTTGVFFFSTNSEPPFARGPQKTRRF